MKKKILFRADTYPQIGTGDLSSLIQLSHYFCDHGWAAFFCVKETNTAKNLLNQHGIESVFFLPFEITPDQEVIELNNLIENHKIDAIFFEITDRPYSKYSSITEEIFKACVCFYGTTDSSFHFILDWGIDTEKIHQHIETDFTTLLLGPENVILPHQFDFSKIEQRIYSDKHPINILILMGGGDEENLTNKVLNSLKCNVDFSITAILGPGFQFQKELQDILVQDPSIKTFECVNDMYHRYLDSDVFIGTGGLVSSEAVATRTPTILISSYEHQIDRCNYFHDKQWVNYLGHIDFKPFNLVKAVYEAKVPKSTPNFNPKNIVTQFEKRYKRFKNETKK